MVLVPDLPLPFVVDSPRILIIIKKYDSFMKTVNLLSCTVLCIIALAFNVYLTSGLYEHICTEKGLYKPYVRVYKGRKGPKLYSNTGPGFFDLQKHNDLYVCVNGPAFYYFNVNTSNGEVFNKPEFNVTSHMCATYNKSPRRDHTNHANGARKLHAILLMGNPEDYRKPSIQLLSAPMWNYNTKKLENGTSIVTFGNEDCVLSKQGKKITIRSPKPKMPGQPEFCMRVFGESITKPDEEVVLRADARISVLGCSPSTIIKLKSAKVSASLKATAVKSKKNALSGNNTSAGSSNKSGSANEVLDGRSNSDSDEDSSGGSNHTVVSPLLSNEKPDLHNKSSVAQNASKLPPALSTFKSQAKPNASTNHMGKINSSEIILNSTKLSPFRSNTSIGQKTNQSVLNDDGELPEGRTNSIEDSSTGTISTDKLRHTTTPAASNTSKSNSSRPNTATNNDEMLEGRTNSMEADTAAGTNSSNKLRDKVQLGNFSQSFPNSTMTNASKTPAYSNTSIPSPNPEKSQENDERPEGRSGSDEDGSPGTNSTDKLRHKSHTKTDNSSNASAVLPNLLSSKNLTADNAPRPTISPDRKKGQTGNRGDNIATNASLLPSNMDDTSSIPHLSSPEKSNPKNTFPPSLKSNSTATASSVKQTEVPSALPEATTKPTLDAIGSDRKKLQASSQKAGSFTNISEFAPSLVKRTEAPTAVTTSGMEAFETTQNPINMFGNMTNTAPGSTHLPRNKTQAAIKQAGVSVDVKDFVASLVKQTEVPLLETVTGPSTTVEKPDRPSTTETMLATSEPSRQKLQPHTRKNASFNAVKEFSPSLVKGTETPDAVTKLGTTIGPSSDIPSTSIPSVIGSTTLSNNISTTSPPSRKKVQALTRKNETSVFIDEFAASLVKGTDTLPAGATESGQSVDSPSAEAVKEPYTAVSPSAERTETTPPPSFVSTTPVDIVTPRKKIQALTKKATDSVQFKEFDASLVKITETPLLDITTERALDDPSINKPPGIETTTTPSLKKLQASTRKSVNAVAIKEFAPSLVLRGDGTTSPSLALMPVDAPTLFVPTTTTNPSRIKAQALSNKSDKTAVLREFTPSLVKSGDVPQPEVESVTTAQANSVAVTTTQPVKNKVQAVTRKAATYADIDEFAPSLVKQTEASLILSTTVTPNNKVEEMAQQNITSALEPTIRTTFPPKKKVQASNKKDADSHVVQDYLAGLVKFTETPPDTSSETTPSTDRIPLNETSSVATNLERPVTTSIPEKKKVQVSNKKEPNIPVVKDFVASLVKLTESPSDAGMETTPSTERFVHEKTGNVTANLELPVTTSIPERKKVQVSNKKEADIPVVKDFVASLVKITESPPDASSETAPLTDRITLNETSSVTTNLERPVTTSIPERKKVQVSNKKEANIPVVKDFVASLVKLTESPPDAESESTASAERISHEKTSNLTTNFELPVPTNVPERKKVQVSNKKEGNVPIVKDFIASLVQRTENPIITTDVVPELQPSHQMSTITPTPGRNKIQVSAKFSNRTAVIRDFLPGLVERTESPLTVTFNSKFVRQTNNNEVPEESQIPAPPVSRKASRSLKTKIRSKSKKSASVVARKKFAPFSDLGGNRFKRRAAQSQPTVPALPPSSTSSPPPAQNKLPELIELTECEPLPILQAECDAGRPNKEHACKLFSGMLGTPEPIWPPGTEWRQEILNLIADIFARTCTRIPRQFAIKIANIFKFYLASALTGKTVEPERETWKNIINELSRCKKLAAVIEFKFQSKKKGPKNAYLKNGFNIQANIKITEEAENEYAFNWALDMNWKVFSTVIAMCLPMSIPGKASLSSRFYSMYIQDFLNPIINTWVEYKDNLIFQFILGEYYHGDTEAWVNNCLEGSYALWKWDQYRPIRPMLVNDMLEYNYVAVNKLGRS